MKNEEINILDICAYTPEEQKEYFSREGWFTREEVLKESQILLHKALILAEEQHKWQDYADWDFLYNHVIPISDQIFQDSKKYWYNKYKLTILAILHDVPEKWNISKRYIQNMFGKRIADGSDRLSRRRENEEINRTSKEYFENSFEKIGDILVKARDRIFNLKHMETLPDHKKSIIISEYIDEFHYFEKFFDEWKLEKNIYQELLSDMKMVIQKYKKDLSENSWPEAIRIIFLNDI